MIVINQPAIDWLTMTAYGSRLPVVAERAVRTLNIQTTKPAKRMQYEGLNYLTAEGQVFIGAGIQRATKHYLVTSSGYAGQCMFQPLQSLLTTDTSAKVTRIDLQITVAHPDRDGYQWRLFNRMKRQGKSVGYIESTDAEHGNLATVYVGSRKSERMFRIYEKVCDGEVMLRFEVEYKRDLSAAVARMLSRNISPGALLLMELQTRFENDEIRARFEPVLSGIAPAKPSILRQPPGTERWLLEQVLPAFTKFINDHNQSGQVVEAYRDAIAAADNRILYGSPNED